MAVAEKTADLPPENELIEIDLKNPWVAGLLAFLWPGAGHIYQGRHGKGLLFMVCILSTLAFGLAVSEGHAVYASWTKEDFRYPYICQAAVGLPTLVPSIIQYRRVMAGQPALWHEFMAPPRQPVVPEGNDELAEWNKKLSFSLEVGTVYTMIAGLLNLLAIYDAMAGPALAMDEEEEEKTDKPPPDASAGKGQV